MAEVNRRKSNGDNWLVEKIKNSNIYTRKNRREYVQRIKTKMTDNQIKVAQGICPRCGGKLVGRNGKNGFFFDVVIIQSVDIRNDKENMK